MTNIIKSYELLQDKQAQNIFNQNEKKLMCKGCFRPLTSIEQTSISYNMWSCFECDSREYSVANIKQSQYLRNPIWKIGLEMEGLWEYMPKSHELLIEHEDCSVKNLDGIDCEFVGEYITRPVLFNKTGLAKLESCVYDAYPHFVNRTCGGHFHLSFRDMRFYDIAMEKEMYDGLITHLYTWGEKNLNKKGMNRLNERLDNYTHGTDYCQPKHMPEQQVDGNGDRYCHLNFDYFKHRTMEVRILPMFSDATTYLDAVDTCTRFISRYITKHSKFTADKTNYQTKFDIKGNIPNVTKVINRK